ncbi:response regulator [Dyadobacter subterraneus]|uniref:Response regulator n=1 Tax=Dyadobacter subterraneus TaxID=2773304 RepID=A0ABR9WAW5_9BACT|nr:response regulator [Dyadobacter subterraneus]MBE9462605.1 response regulator [Dyadobacter subterraneus]
MQNLKTIFLADDDADDRFLIKEAIREVDSEIKVIEAENGFELLTLMEESGEADSAIVVLDMNMPKMNGLETLDAIRSIPHLSMIPAVMLSTSSDSSFAQLAYKAGISIYLTKPDSFEAFIDLIQQLTNQFL